MGKQTRNRLKGYFETGQKPVGANYVDLIDSYLLVDGENTGSIDIQGSITASGDISASGTIYADTFQSHGNTEIGVSDSLNITGGITSSGGISSSGNIITDGWISASSYVSASSFSGDGKGLTNITASSLSIQQITASYISGSIQASGSLTYTSGSTSVLYAIQSSGSIIPDANAVWDLGGPNHYWKDLFLSEGSLRFVSSSGEISILSQENVKDLKAGKTTQAAKTADAAGDEVETTSTNYIRPAAIYHPTDDETVFLLNTAGKVVYRSPGGDPFTIYADGGSNDYIRLGSTTTNATQVRIPGTISASNSSATHIIGGTLKHVGGAISSSGKISASGGFETDNSASFGHISASGDLKIDGFASFGGFGNVQSMSSTTTVPTNTNMILYGPITIGASATLDIAVDSQVLIKDLANA